MGATKQAMLAAMDDPDEETQKRCKLIFEAIEDVLADSTFVEAAEVQRTVDWLQEHIDAVIGRYRDRIEDMEADEEIERLMAKDD